MKKLFYALVVLAMMAALAMPALAGGGQNLGSEGRGAVQQHQVMDPPPFNP